MPVFESTCTDCQSRIRVEAATEKREIRARCPNCQTINSLQRVASPKSAIPVSRPTTPAPSRNIYGDNSYQNSASATSSIPAPSPIPVSAAASPWGSEQPNWSSPAPRYQPAQQPKQDFTTFWMIVLGIGTTVVAGSVLTVTVSGVYFVMNSSFQNRTAQAPPAPHQPPRNEMLREQPRGAGPDFVATSREESQRRRQELLAEQEKRRAEAEKRMEEAREKARVIREQTTQHHLEATPSPPSIPWPPTSSPRPNSPRPNSVTLSSSKNEADRVEVIAQNVDMKTFSSIRKALLSKPWGKNHSISFTKNVLKITLYYPTEEANSSIADLEKELPGLRFISVDEAQRVIQAEGI